MGTREDPKKRFTASTFIIFPSWRAPASCDCLHFGCAVFTVLSRTFVHRLPRLSMTTDISLRLAKGAKKGDAFSGS